MAASKIGRTTVWVLMGFLIFGLMGFGITEFSSGGNGAVGSVGQTRITVNEYSRAVRQQNEAAIMQLQRPITLDEARALGLIASAQQQLVTSAVMEEEARVLGVSASDRSVAEAVVAIPAFRGMTGQFDRTLYNEMLRRQRMTAAEFEQDMRMDLARQIIMAAVTGGIDAPRPLVDRQLGWLLETRDIAWQELTGADLAEPVTLPDEQALRAWHEANAARFTAPETRHISYAWLTPEMLQDEVQIDEAALRALYDQMADEFNRPARRLVDRLVYPTQADAVAARARADLGASFDDLAAERGLSRADTDLGEVTEAQLGQAGPEVFAAAENGILGPVQTELGPALFSLNAIMDPVQIPFEEARDDLRTEAAIDRARRVIEDRAHSVADLLAGGAMLEDLAAEAGMELGQIDWPADQEPAPGSIAAYPSFREQAGLVQPDAFPELFELADGGIFVLRLDEVTPPALIPFDEARAGVEADWLAAETRRRLLAVAEARREAAMADEGGVAAPVDTPSDAGNEAPDHAAGGVQDADAAPDAGTQPGADAVPQAEPAAAPTAPALHEVAGLGRDGYVEGAPLALIAQAFAIPTPGETEIVDADDRVFLVTLRAINRADLDDEGAGVLRDHVGAQLRQSLAGDVFDAYIRAAMAAHGVRWDASAAAVAETQAQ